MGPFEQTIAWDPRGVLGVRRFLDKVWKSHEKVRIQESGASSKELDRKLHQLIKKVEEDTLSLKFNTAVAEMMKFINELADSNWQLETGDWKLFLRVLAPYAPHLAEEMYQSLKEGEEGKSVHLQPWPKYDPKLIVEETVTVIVQVNGKMRGKLELPAGTGEAEITERAQSTESVAPHLHGRKVAKTIFIPDNLINFVIS